MGKIHLQVEEGRSLAQKMNRAAGELFDSATMLKSQVSRLSGAWTGGDAEDFVRRARRCTNSLENFSDQFEQLGVSLGHEIDQWVMADADGVGRIGSSRLAPKLGSDARSGGSSDIASGIGDFTGVGISAGIAIYGGISSGATFGSPWSGENGFRWDKWALDVVEDVPDTVKGIGKVVPEVGKVFKKFKPILDTPVLKHGVPFVFDFASGLMEGESVQKALLSGGISAAITGVIVANPVGSTILGLNSGVQLAGNLVAGGLRIFGKEEAAGKLENVLDVIDLSGYVEKLSDAVADFVLNGEVRAGVNADVKAALGRFSCGIQTKGEFKVGWNMQAI